MEKKSLFQYKLTVLTGAIFLVGIISSGLLTYRHINNSMLEQNKQKLEAVLGSRITAVEEYFRMNKEHVAHLAENEMIINAVRDFASGYASLAEDVKLDLTKDSEKYAKLMSFYESEFIPKISDNKKYSGNVEDYIPGALPGRLAQWLYISKNPNPVGSKNNYASSAYYSAYNVAHQFYHPKFNNFMRSFGYYDIFLFDMSGNLTYSTFKELDFATNFLNGPYLDTGLGKVFREASVSSRVGEVFSTDIATYEPSYNAPALFLASPVFDGVEKIGVLAFQLHNNKLNAVVSDLHGLGNSGETYIVGSDLLMRSDSRFFDKSTILKQRVDTIAAKLALRGETGTNFIPDYRNIEVLSHYAPLSISGFNWGMIAEVDRSEIVSTANRIALYTVGIIVLTLIIVALVSYISLKEFVLRPLAELLSGAQKIREGDYSWRVNIKGQDEFQKLADSHNMMADSIQSHVSQLEKALAEVRELRGLLPICPACKSVKDDDGYWKTIETYLVAHTNTEFTHSLCKHCVPLFYPELNPGLKTPKSAMKPIKRKLEIVDNSKNNNKY